MYLSDNELIARLPEIDFECGDEAHPFNSADQIQPCSIDLRLSSVFWEPRRGATVDLRKSALLELQPRRYYKRIALKADESITLKPGAMLIGRTYEKFSVPPDCAAKIEGRSSFGRLGIGIHCTNDFANPGYRGNFPLILTNNSPTPIKFFPFIPICQLLLVPLSSIPTRTYGDSVLQSKYMDDDGGPSYWWRDKRIKVLQKILQKNSLELSLQNDLLNKVGIREPEVIERFEKFITKSRLEKLGNSEQVLSEFASTEERAKNIKRIINGGWIVALTILASIAGSLTTSKPYLYWYYIVWASTLLCVWPCIRAFTVPESTYYGIKEHAEASQSNA